MDDIDKMELRELKKKRQEQLLKENPPSRIIKVIKDEFDKVENNRTDRSGRVMPIENVDTRGVVVDDRARKSSLDELRQGDGNGNGNDNGNGNGDGGQGSNGKETPRHTQTSSRKRVNIQQVLDNTSEEETFIRLGKLKINGIWEVMITIGATIFAIVGAWINFDMTLTANTKDIMALQKEFKEYSTSNEARIDAIFNDLLVRIVSLERRMNILDGTADKYKYRYDKEINSIYADLNAIKTKLSQHDKDMTAILRDLNRVESKVGTLTK